MNKTELVNKLLWLGYTSAEEGTKKRKEAVNMAHNLLDEYLEAINYTHSCESDSEQFKPFKEAKGMCKKCLRHWCICEK